LSIFGTIDHRLLAEIEEDEVAREKLAISLDDRCDSPEPDSEL
jgi:hypothetical protein